MRVPDIAHVSVKSSDEVSSSNQSSFEILLNREQIERLTKLWVKVTGSRRSEGQRSGPWNFGQHAKRSLDLFANTIGLCGTLENWILGNVRAQAACGISRAQRRHDDTRSTTANYTSGDTNGCDIEDFINDGNWYPKDRTGKVPIMSTTQFPSCKRRKWRHNQLRGDDAQRSTASLISHTKEWLEAARQ